MFLTILDNKEVKMNFLKILLTISYFKFSSTALNSPNVTSEEALTSTAIADICEEFFIKKSIKFDLIIYGERTRHLQDVADGVLGLISSFALITVQHVENITQWHHNLEDSAVLLFKITNYLTNFNYLTNLTNFSPKEMKFLIYCENYDNFEAVPVVTYYNTDGAHISSYEYFIIDAKDNIQVMTFDHFRDDSCKSIVSKSYKIVNNFKKSALKWQPELTADQKFTDFKGCMLTLTS
ncbi:hypothetical protein ACKWTF_015168 [Chironomus riparius]